MTTRRTYIDWARGLAVLVMIEAHTFDAWTRPASRHGEVWGYLGLIAGYAAPAFLWLAGVGVALSAASTLRRTGSRRAAVDAVCRRGLAIFILAFLFRLQAFIVSPGSHPVTLFRVDILNVMGPAMVIAGLVWAVVEAPVMQAVAYAAIACGIAMLTPVVRTAAFVDALPIWTQWYLRPSADHTTFTAFPWAGFVFAGAGCGVLLAAARDAAGERRLQTGVATAGMATIALALYAASRPSIYRQSSFWTSSPTYFAVRVGILMIALALLYATSRIPGTGLGQRAAETRSRLLSALERLGRRSLFVYWIHVELVYGYATWPIRQKLPLWGTAIAFALFSALIYAAILGRDRVVENWRSRHDQRNGLIRSYARG